jgi:hypothetical protein
MHRGAQQQHYANNTKSQVEQSWQLKSLGNSNPLATPTPGTTFCHDNLQGSICAPEKSRTNNVSTQVA